MGTERGTAIVSIPKANSRIEDRVFAGTLNDSKAAQEFAALLRLSLTLEDYASTEKISDLPKRLSTEGAAPGFDPSGDIAYYAPWGNLAVFTKTSVTPVDSSRSEGSTLAWTCWRVRILCRSRSNLRSPDAR